MKVFEIDEARRAGLDSRFAPLDSRWVLTGRAYENVKLGDRLLLGGADATVEGIRTYGKGTDSLRKMLTGELLVRWSRVETVFHLTR